MKEVRPNLTSILDQLKATGILQARTLCERVLEETREKAEVFMCCINTHTLTCMYMYTLTLTRTHMYTLTLTYCRSSHPNAMIWKVLLSMHVHLRECQTFDEKEATNINYVLRVHSILFRHGIDVPQQDKVASCKLTHTHTHTHTLSKKQNIFMPVIRTYIYLYEM